MALNIWTVSTGFSLGTYYERVKANIELPVADDQGVTYSIISGKLPGGLRLSGNSIIGTPYEVPRVTEFQFCVRASLNNEISDRTLKIIISGEDPPIFVTPEGDLAIGPNDQLFVLDSSYVNFQIEAIDFDTAAGQQLSFFIAGNDGELPPGLSLTTDGRIVGFVQPVFSIKPEDGNGFYDTGPYDGISFDFGTRNTNGFDSYMYDSIFYDFSLNSLTPRKLNRNYEFYVTVTDGDTSVKRRFKIFVVGDDYFRADNNILTDGTGLFTADVTYLRAPIWLTPSNLGTYRANNYLTFVLDTYDTENVIYIEELVNADVYALAMQYLETDNVVGSNYLTISRATVPPKPGQYVTFTGIVVGGTSELHQVLAVSQLGNGGYRLQLSSPLEVSIPDEIGFLIGSLSQLPPGMEVDVGNAEVFGKVPYQPAVTKTYQFTITARRVSDKEEEARSSRIFTVQIIGEIDSIITWNTDSNLGTANANFISTLSINASSSIPDAVVIYRKTAGKLPPGLTLNADGEIIGKIKQYGDSIVYRSNWRPNREYPVNSVVLYNTYFYKRTVEYTVLESTFDMTKWELYSFKYNYRSIWLPLTRYSINDIVLYNKQFYRRIKPYTIELPENTFDLTYWEEFYEGFITFSDMSTETTFKNQSFDAGETTIDRVYHFTAEALDQYNYSASKKDFYITVETPNQLIFSNIRVKPYLKLEQRDLWNEFINDSTIFTSESIYRPNDPSFGIQRDLSMLIYAGIETKEAAAYVGAMGLNHKRKRFYFNSVKKAIAYSPGTKTPVYEVVYVEMRDPLELNGKYLKSRLENLSKQNQTITVDNSNILWQKGFTKSDPLTQEQQRQLDILNIPAPTANRPDPFMTVDSTGYQASNPNPTTYFPNSVSLWRQNIKTKIGETERNYLPLWMRSIQPDKKQELDFVLCVPLCYCKTGTADDILLNVKFSEFDFKLLDYTIDRYIIDAVEGSTEDKYLVFRNDRITV